MQLILGRQRPDEGNGHGNFFKHHAVNTAFPGGRSAVPNLGVTCPPFFRCEAPRFYISPYSSVNVSHALTTSGDCHAR